MRTWAVSFAVVAAALGACSSPAASGSAGPSVAASAIDPWTAPPDEPIADIDARWQRVVAWSAVPLDDAGAPASAFESSALGAVIGDARFETRDELDLEQRTRTGDPVDAASLSPRLARAVASLVAWDRAEPPRGPRCSKTPMSTGAASGHSNPFGLVRLARVAFALADTEADEKVHAVLRLSHELRTAGWAVVDAEVGQSLFRSALAWAERRGVVPGATFAAFAPRDAEEFPFLARHWVCAVEVARANGVRGTRDGVRKARALFDEARAPAAELLDAGLGPRVRRVTLGPTMQSRRYATAERTTTPTRAPPIARPTRANSPCCGRSSGGARSRCRPCATT